MIYKAIERAYKILKERNWDTVYWAIDLHGVCLESNYENGGYRFINEDAVKGLRLISSLPESRIILWSSAHKHEHQPIIEFFAQKGIKVSYFNENPEVPNTKTGDFSDKFYFSIILDDKAGFDPETDWKIVSNWTSVFRAVWLQSLSLQAE